MGKLNIAHHKSYHPYRRDNIERVRKDEEDARLQEEKEEGRMRLADSEARIDLLRQRAGVSKLPKSASAVQTDAGDTASLITSQPQPAAQEAPDTLRAPTGHINLFASLESSAAALATTAALTAARQKGKPKEDEEGVRLAPSKRDLKPWYTDEELKGGKEREEGEGEREVRRMKDLSHKKSSDPLREMNALLAQRARARNFDTSGPSFPRRPPPPHPPAHPKPSDPALANRLSRESAERQRALALIERKKREMMSACEIGSEIGTPMREGYGDVYNWEAVRDAGERRKGQWGRDRGRDREREWERDRGRRQPDTSWDRRR